MGAQRGRGRGGPLRGDPASGPIPTFANRASGKLARQIKFLWCLPEGTGRLAHTTSRPLKNWRLRMAGRVFERERTRRRHDVVHRGESPGESCAERRRPADPSGFSAACQRFTARPCAATSTACCTAATPLCRRCCARGRRHRQPRQRRLAPAPALRRLPHREQVGPRGACGFAAPQGAAAGCGGVRRVSRDRGHARHQPPPRQRHRARAARGRPARAHARARGRDGGGRGRAPAPRRLPGRGKRGGAVPPDDAGAGRASCLAGHRARAVPRRARGARGGRDPLAHRLARADARGHARRRGCARRRGGAAALRLRARRGGGGRRRAVGRAGGGGATWLAGRLALRRL